MQDYLTLGYGELAVASLLVLLNAGLSLAFRLGIHRDPLCLPRLKCILNHDLHRKGIACISLAVRPVLHLHRLRAVEIIKGTVAAAQRQVARH